MKVRPSPRVLLIAAAAIAVLYGYPGFLTRGGDDQLVDSRVGAFTDWAPPLMTELWRVLGWLWSGPAPMFLVQIVLLVAGAYHLLATSYRPRAAAAWAAVIVVMPPVLATMAVIWPESQLAAVGIAAAAAFGARSWVRWLALPLTAYAASLGSGAAVAMLPIVLVRCELVRGPRVWLRYVVAFAVWAALVLAGAGLGRVLVDQPTHRDDNALAIDDIIGILRESGPISDAEARSALDGIPLAIPSDLQRAARALDGHTERYASGPSRLFDHAPDASQADALARARHTLMLAHPVAYLHHRLRRATRVLGFHRRKTWVATYSRFVGAPGDVAPLQHTAHHSAVQRALLAAVHVLSHSLLFHPYVYALLALVLLPIAIVWRARDAAMLLASGLAGEIAMLLTNNHAEVHYSLWLIVTTLAAIPLLLATRAASRGSRAPLAQSPARAPGP